MLRKTNHFVSMLLCCLLSVSAVQMPLYAEETVTDETEETVGQESLMTDDSDLSIAEDAVTEETEEIIEPETVIINDSDGSAGDENAGVDEELTLSESEVENDEVPLTDSEETDNTEEKNAYDDISEVLMDEPGEEHLDPNAAVEIEETAENENTVYEAHESGFEYEYEFQSNIYNAVKITGYKGTATDIVIPGYLSGAGTVLYIAENAFAGNTNITSVTIEAELWGIEDNAFSGCTNLTTVTFKRDKNITIGNKAFYNCENLTDFDFSIIYKVGEYAFAGCKSLTSAQLLGVYDIKKGMFSGCSHLTRVETDRQLFSIGDYAFYNCSKLENIFFNDEVTYIGSYAFHGCSNLKKNGYTLSIPASVTRVGFSAFENCSSLTDVKFEGELTEIEERTFSNCTNLKSLTLPENLTKINNNAFVGCSGLESIAIPDSVSDIAEYAFYGCSSLKQVNIPKGITTINKSTFYNCSSLEEIVIPENVTTINNNAFGNCSSLARIVIPASVQTFGRNIFNGCGSLKTVGGIGSGSNIEFGWTEEIPENAFLGASGITSVIIPSEITKLGDYSFQECQNLTSVSIPASVTDIGIKAFYKCSGLPDIMLPSGLISIGDYAFLECGISAIRIPGSVQKFGMEPFGYCEKLTHAVIEEGITEVGSHAFYQCENLQNVTIPESVNKINGIVFSGCAKLKSAGPVGSGSNIEFGWKESIPENAFYYSEYLSSITVPDGVTDIGENAFGSCPNLSKVIIPESVTRISGAFKTCRLLQTAGPIGGGYNIEFGWTEAIPKSAFYETEFLTSVKIPDTVTKIGADAFGYCEALTAVDIPYGVETIEENCFANCWGLTNAAIPDSVTTIKDSGFYNCKRLVDLRLSDKVEKIGAYAFYLCSSLTNIIIPESVNDIGMWAFSTNYKMESVSIPEGVTRIRFHTFEDSPVLSKVFIPASVTSIEESAFKDCPLLQDVYYAGTEEDWKKITIGNENDAIKNAVIHYEYHEETAVESISIDSEDTRITVNEKETLRYTILPVNAGNRNVLWSSSDSTVVSVDENGIITGISDGTAVITVTTEDGGFTDTCTVTVYTVHAEGISIDEEESISEIEFGNTGSIRIAFNPANTTDQTLRWTSSDESIAIVSEDGMVTAVGEGTVTITAVSDDGGFTVSKELNVRYNHIESVSFEEDSVELPAGSTYQLNVSFLPENASNRSVSYSSDDEGVAEADSSGLVRGISEGTAVITVTTEDGNKTAVCTVTVVTNGIYVKELSSDYSFTGTAIKPEIEVYDSGRLLAANTDYTITYKNNTKAYTLREGDEGFSAKKAPQIVIKAKGNYSGTKTVYFTIDPLDISEEQSEVLTAGYTGKVQKLSPTVMYEGKTLKKGTDYTVTYPSEGCKDPGTYEIKVTGKRNYTGTRTYQLVIGTEEQISLSKAAVTLDQKSYAYTGEQIRPVVTKVKVGKTEVNPEDYTVIYGDNNAVGNGTVTITGNDSTVIGTKTVTFKITGTPVTKLIQMTVPKSVSRGTVLKDTVSVTTELLEGTDYEIEYPETEDAGKKTIIITGISGYTGTIKKTVTVTPDKLTSENTAVTVSDAKHSKNGAKPEVTVSFDGNILSEGSDYTLTYANNKKAGTGTVTVKGKGNYTGSIKQTFTIRAKDISETELVYVNDANSSSKKGSYKTTVVIRDEDGGILKANTDYTLKFYDGEEEIPSTATSNDYIGKILLVEVLGKGNYTGYMYGTYEVTDSTLNLAKATIRIKNQEYLSGKLVEITSQDQISKALIGKTSLTLNEDFEVYSYSNNTEKGTATVVFKGINGYSGYRTVTYKIGQRSIAEYWNGVKQFFSSLF